METKEFEKRKNVLDLYFQKFLQYKITAILIIFTFFIGAVIGFLTKQLKINNFIDWMLVGGLSIAVLGIGTSFIREFDSHLDNILIEIKKL